MNKSLSKRLEKFLKENLGTTLPDIRFFDGTESFSDNAGRFKSKSLDESLDLFLAEKGF